jgi:hypothetical protein
MQRWPRPDFLIGTFDWKARGYVFAAQPPPEVVSGGIPHGANPWLLVAHALHASRGGNRRPLEELRRLILDDPDEPTMLRASFDLLADAGHDEDLGFLAELMRHGSRYQQLAACTAAQWTGDLRLVPPMLEVWRAMTREADRTEASLALSNMLDDENPPGGELRFFEPDCGDEEFAERVRARVVELRGMAEDGRSIVFAGEVFDLAKVAQKMLDLLRQGRVAHWADWSYFLLARRRFEAVTGVDCSGFYVDKVFNPDGVLEVVSEFQESGVARNFIPGVRYFCGLRIE